MGDNIVHPHVSRVAAAAPRGIGFSRKRARAQSAVRDQDAHDARHARAAYLHPDVALVASAAAEKVSLVAEFPHVFSVDTDAACRFSVRTAGDRFADAHPLGQVLRRILGDGKDKEELTNNLQPTAHSLYENSILCYNQ